MMRWLFLFCLLPLSAVAKGRPDRVRTIILEEAREIADIVLPGGTTLSFRSRYRKHAAIHWSAWQPYWARLGTQASLCGVEFPPGATLWFGRDQYQRTVINATIHHKATDIVCPNNSAKSR
jgi:hypothetical protein